MYIENFLTYYKQYITEEQLQIAICEGYHYTALDENGNIYFYMRRPNISPNGIFYTNFSNYHFVGCFVPYKNTTVENWNSSCMRITELLSQDTTQEKENNTMKENSTMEITVTVEDSNTLKLSYNSFVLYVCKQDNKWTTVDELLVKLPQLSEFTEFYDCCKDIIGTLNNEQPTNNKTDIKKLPDVLSDAIVDLHNGYKIEAIKTVREGVDCDLCTAKYIVESILQFDYSLYDVNRS